MQRPVQLMLTPCACRLILDITDMQLGFDTATIWWSQSHRSDNRVGADTRLWAFVHWDNFGFTGPQPKSITHDFLVQKTPEALMMMPGSTNFTVNISSPLNNASASRLMFSTR
jgi:hypothetical protein